MKKALIASLVFISFTAYAGDLYLVCEDEKNDDFLSATIENGQGSLMITANEGQPIYLEAKKINTPDTTLFRLKIKMLGQRKTENIDLSVFEEIKIGNYLCLIRD